MKYLHKLLQLCQQKCDNKLVENENKYVYYPLVVQHIARTDDHIKTQKKEQEQKEQKPFNLSIYDNNILMGSILL